MKSFFLASILAVLIIVAFFYFRSVNDDDNNNQSNETVETQDGFEVLTSQNFYEITTSQFVSTQDSTTTVAWTPDSKRIGVANDTAVYIYLVEDGELIQAPTRIYRIEEVEHLSFSQDGRYLGATSESGVYIWDTISEDRNATYADQDCTGDLAFVSNQDVAVICGSGSNLWLEVIGITSLRTETITFEDDLRKVAFDSETRYLVVRTRDYFYIHDVENGVVGDMIRQINAMGLSAYGSELLSKSYLIDYDRRYFRLIDLRDLDKAVQVIEYPFIYDNTIHSVIVMADESVALMSRDDFDGSAYDIASGIELQDLQWADSKYMFVSPNHKYIALIDQSPLDHSVRLARVRSKD